MAERKRSKDEGRETEQVPGPKGEVSHQGRTGGTSARDAGTRNEVERIRHGPGGRARPAENNDNEEGEER